MICFNHNGDLEMYPFYVTANSEFILVVLDDTRKKPWVWAIHTRNLVQNPKVDCWVDVENATYRMHSNLCHMIGLSSHLFYYYCHFAG